MLSYSCCRERDISLKSRPFSTAWGLRQCLLVLTTVRQTALWR
ncbi:heat-shock protein [Lelliottia sp. F153]|nr:heat-shock protein [Lelliottia sp. WB101]PKA31369.1 heat-shock protein [Cedecea lapagei]PLY47372.1 heat-shock protein [Lelliottia sp. F159]PLY51490.1 heat-shock protein [Lelliottia sp. F154]PLY54436.1 heat-shock protein [Lelliottia sp. F153]UQC71775.1 heat-shock protein [Lelliottia sp. AC1]